MKYNGTDLPPELEQALCAHFSQPKNALLPIPPMKTKFTSGHTERISLGLAITAISALITFLLFQYL